MPIQSGAAHHLGHTQPAARRGLGLENGADALVTREEPLVALPDMLTQDLVVAGARSGQHGIKRGVHAPGIGGNLAFNPIRKAKALLARLAGCRQVVEAELPGLCRSRPHTGEEHQPIMLHCHGIRLKHGDKIW